jgi:ketosteroid isomerase-like protein
VRDTQPVMSEENVELVRRGFMATMEEDWPTALGTLDPEVEVLDFDIPDAGVYRGPAGFLAWLKGWAEGWDSWRVEDIEFRDAGDDQVIALFTLIAKGAHSGLELERQDAITYRIRSGKIARTEYFNDQRLAREAVGLPG